MGEKRKMIAEQFMYIQMFLQRSQMQNLINNGPLNDPNRGQGRILAILKTMPEVSQKQLSELLDMSKQSVSTFLFKLEKGGYITRETAVEDRRVFNIKLTESGAAAAADIDDTDYEMERLLDCLNNEEIDNLNDYMTRIIQKLMDEVKALHIPGQPHWEKEHSPDGDADFEKGGNEHGNGNLG